MTELFDRIIIYKARTSHKWTIIVANLVFKLKFVSQIFFCNVTYPIIYTPLHIHALVATVNLRQPAAKPPRIFQCISAWQCAGRLFFRTFYLPVPAAARPWDVARSGWATSFSTAVMATGNGWAPLRACAESKQVLGSQCGRARRLSVGMHCTFRFFFWFKADPD